MSTTTATPGNTLEPAVPPSGAGSRRSHRRRGGLRSGLAVVLGVLVVSTALMVVPSPLVSPAGAQSVCDGPVDGFPTTVTSTGVDAMAERLRGLRDGVDLEPARAGFRWRVPVCMEDTAGGEVYRVRGPATEVVSTAAPMWELGALAEVRADLEARFWRPAPQLAPDLAGKQVVGLETWLAIDPDTWETFTATATVEEVTVSATATPVRTVWTFPDMVLRCNGPGVIYDPAVGGRPPCGRHWDHTSEVEPMSVQVQIEYQVTWSSSIDNSGTTTWVADPLGAFDLFVGEIQSLGTRGDNPPLWDPGFVTRPAEQLPDCTLIMIVEGDCATGVAALDEDVKRCIVGVALLLFGDAVACLRDLAGAAVDELVALAGPLGAVLSLAEGCIGYLGDAASGLFSLGGELFDAAQDPIAYVRENVAFIYDLIAAATADPAGFATEFLGEQLDLALLGENPAQWAGQMGCEIALTLFTGGAAAAGGRIAKLIDRLDDIRDWTRNKRDRDRANTCGRSSFPTGTPVRMANGALKPIELIQPGDWILAANPRTRQWEPQVVLDQWSYVDRGRMATATLTNGTTITATDHHNFWVTNTHTWHRLDQIRPGDRLLTPHGTTTITNVHTSNPTTTLVWELDTAGPNTFTVHTGTHDVLVHNQDDGGCLPDLPPAIRQRVLDVAERLGVDPEYLARLAQDPSKGNSVTEASIREAEVALRGVGAGNSTVLSFPLGAYYPGPLRSPDRELGDFIDGTGYPWDVKAFDPERPRNSIDDILRIIEREIDTGEGIVLDTSKMTDEFILELADRLESMDLQGPVVIVLESD